MSFLRLVVIFLGSIFKSRRVGCELAFKQLLAADTNRGSALANDNRPGERPHDP